MSRTLTSGVITALTSTSVFPAFFVSCQFANETIYLFSGIGTVSWNGHTWSGAGTLGSISPIGEASGVQAQGITLTLTGIDPTWLSECMMQITTSGVAQVFLAFYDGSGNMIASPVPAYLGLMDQPVIDVDAKEVKITISVENKLSDLNRARGGRYTDQDQRQRHPNDSSLLYVSLLQDTFVNWKS